MDLPAVSLSDLEGVEGGTGPHDVCMDVCTAVVGSKPSEPAATICHSICDAVFGGHDEPKEPKETRE
jgi:hypothetical protein